MKTTDRRKSVPHYAAHVTAAHLEALEAESENMIEDGSVECGWILRGAIDALCLNFDQDPGEGHLYRDDWKEGFDTFRLLANGKPHEDPEDLRGTFDRIIFHSGL